MIVCNTLRREIKPNSRVYVAPEYNTIGLSLAKEWLKIDPTDNSEDNVINQCLVGAIKEAEAYTRRVIEKATWRSFMTGFATVRIDVFPVILSTLVVKYYDAANALQTLSPTEYVIYDNGPDDYPFIEFTGTLPELYSRNENVFMEYNAGYEYYPEDMTLAILRKATDFFEIRSNEFSGSSNVVNFDFHKTLFPYKML